MTHDDFDDAEFNAFLKGEDELSRRLQAMPQPAPGAQLDAAILKRVKFAAAQDGRSAAANDAGAPVPRPASRLSWRWRIPAGIAATVLAGVFAHQAFRISTQEPAPAAEPASEVLVETPRAEQPAVASQESQDAAPAAKLARPTPGQAGRQRLADSDKRSSAVADSAVQSVPMPQVAEAAPPPPMQAATPAPGGSLAKESATVSGSELAKFRAPSRAAPVAILDAPAWLLLIDEKLKAGLARDAAQEWARFREAYPDYPVPDALTSRINAIEK